MLNVAQSVISATSAQMMRSMSYHRINGYGEIGSCPLSSKVAEVSLRRLGLRTVRPDLNMTRMSAYIYSFQRHLSFSFLLFGFSYFLRGVEVGYATLNVWPV
jgi:hypothetical protein